MIPFTTRSGAQVDLYAPREADIDLLDLAEQVSKIARFNGATPGTIYFVGQHLALGTDRLLEAGETQAAAYFLCHDLHEGLLGDDTTPKKRSLDRIAAEFGAAQSTISEAYARQVERHDAAIHARAGLAWPPSAAIAALVHETDMRMLLTEWRDLMPGDRPSGDFGDLEPFRGISGVIVPWDWGRTFTELVGKMDALLPALAGRREA